jgi:hypothetical protein
MAEALSGGNPPYRRWAGRAFARVVAIVLIAFHCVLAPLGLISQAAAPAGPKAFARFQIHVPEGVDIAGKDLIVVNAPSILHTAYFLVEREFDNLPRPDRLRVLATGDRTFELYRPNTTTLVIRPEAGFMGWTFDRLSVEILELNGDGRPAAAAFDFGRPLEDESLYWLAWQDTRFVPFRPPGVGERVNLTCDEGWFWRMLSEE